MKVELSDLVDAVDFQMDEAQSYINKSSGEVVMITNEELSFAECKASQSDYPEWMHQGVIQATKFIEDPENYLDLPTKFDFHEYRIMEKFISTIQNEEQQNEMYGLIKGNGAFKNFRWGIQRLLLEESWFKYRDEALTNFVTDWCALNDIEIKID